jgi:hypothetical protein
MTYRNRIKKIADRDTIGEVESILNDVCSQTRFGVVQVFRKRVGEGQSEGEAIRDAYFQGQYVNEDQSRV